MTKKKKPTKKKSDENLGGVTNGFLDLVANYLENKERLRELHHEQELLLVDMKSHKVPHGTIIAPFEDDDSEQQNDQYKVVYTHNGDICIIKFPK